MHTNKGIYVSLLYSSSFQNQWKKQYLWCTGKVRFLCHKNPSSCHLGHFCCLALPIIKSLTCEKSQCENKIYQSLKTKPVREYWRTFVFVSFLHASIKTWCSYLFQLSNIDTRNARKNLTIKDKEVSNKN